MKISSKRISYYFSNLIKPQRSSRSENKILIAGLEASGSTFMYQVSRRLGLNVLKIHGARPNNQKEFTLFPFRDIRDVVTSNAKRVQEQMWKEGRQDEALIAEIDRFVEQGFPDAIYKSRQMTDVVMVRYESFFPGNELSLIRFIADQFIVPLGYDGLREIASQFSVDANQNISKRFEKFDNWDKETLVHGNHITNKGLPGGWKNAFSKNVEQYFKHFLGDLLVDLSYEKDTNWSA